MAMTVIKGRGAQSKTSNHSFVGPPAMSNIPPMTPATPPGVPAPFPYMAQSSSASSTASKVKIAGGEALTVMSIVDVMPSPGNAPSQPAPIHDLVTMMVNQKIKLT
jgi:uncharacterized protein (DUF2345 family)